MNYSRKKKQTPRLGTEEKIAIGILVFMMVLVALVVKDFFEKQIVLEESIAKTEQICTEAEIATQKARQLRLEVESEKAVAVQMSYVTIEPKVEEPVHQYSEVVKNMTEEEYDLLVRILALEAQGEPYEGQLAVVEVILNRVIDERFPNTIKGVLSEKKQFATWKWLDNPYNIPNETQYKAVDYVLKNGLTILPSTKYIYFGTGKDNGTKFIKIKHHYFSK